MRTVVFVNNNFKRKNSFGDLIIGLLLFAISFSGLFMGSKFILKLVMYLVPIGLLLYSLNILKIAISLFKTDKKHFVIFLIQAFLIMVGAIYVIWFPIESLNYIIIFIGGILIINSINTMLLTGTSALSFGPFLLGTLLILFSDSIINTFYKLFLIVLLFISISKITKFFIRLKNRT
jgi:hypothetical protein